MRILTSLLLAAVLWCFAAPPVCRSGEPETVYFGACLSLSGKFRDYGRIYLAGINLFLDDFNARAEENGFRLEMLLRDDESEPAVAAAIVEELAATGNVPVIVGAVTSGLFAAMAEKARECEVVVVSPAATSPRFGKNGDWCFKVLFSDDYQGEVLARFLGRTLDGKTYGAIINDSFEYGESLFRAFQREFSAEGGSLVAEERYEWNLDEDHIPDFTGILMMVKMNRPDIVLLPGYAEDAVAIIHQSQAVDFHPVFCGGDGWVNEKVVLASGHNLEGAYFVGGADLYADTPEAKRFLSLYDSSNDPDAEPSSVNGFDCMLLVAEALKNARTGPEVKRFLEGVRNFPLAAGVFSYDFELGTKKTLFLHHFYKSGDELASKIVAVVDPE